MGLAKVEVPPFRRRCRCFPVSRSRSTCPPFHLSLASHRDIGVHGTVLSQCGVSLKTGDISVRALEEADITSLVPWTVLV